MNLSDAKWIATDANGKTWAYNDKPVWRGCEDMFREGDIEGESMFLGDDCTDICPPGHAREVSASPMCFVDIGGPIDMRPKPPAPPPTLWERLGWFCKGGVR